MAGRRTPSLLLILFLIHPVFAAVQDSASAGQPPVPGCVTNRPVPPLPATAEQVAGPWKEQLISEWVKAGRIGPPTAPASQPKIDRLSSGIANPKRLSIGDLTDRKPMLVDVRSRVSLMNRNLRELTRAVSIPTR
jgi:hypothetical protein